MEPCEHGHETNIFIVEGEIHNCKTCGVCAFIEAEAKGNTKARAEEVASIAGLKGVPANSANDDLLDSLIEIVEQHVSPEYGCRGCAEMGNPHYVHPKELKECREQMSEAMKDWVHQIFGTKRGDVPKEE